jgi:hypothetical protein
MEDLLNKIAYSRKTNTGTQQDPSPSQQRPIALNAQVVSRKMDIINKELEAIKKQVDEAQLLVKPTQLLKRNQKIPARDKSSRDTNEPLGQDSVMEEKDQRPDVNRFDTIPLSIRTYVREEVQKLERRLPTLVENLLDKMLDDKMVKYIKQRQVQKASENRPPWKDTFVPPPLPQESVDPTHFISPKKKKDEDMDEATEFLLSQLKDAFSRKAIETSGKYLYFRSNWSQLDDSCISWNRKTS